ncbi:MAG: HtrA protease/chaperone protein [Schlesneria sp.]|nr:HtrA protease/chaperone protein [Schlesneria sp.]
MDLRKLSVAWVLTALCAPGLVRADDEEPQSLNIQGARLQITSQDVLVGGSDEPARSITITSDQAPEFTTARLILEGQVQKKMAEAESQSKFWIGLMCTPPGDALRAQLDLANDIGLLVDEVYDGGPAKKAGLQVHDLLISTNVVGKDEVRSLKNLLDLITAVQAAETAAMKVEFLRHGRKQTLEVVPTERPKTLTQRLTISAADPSSKAMWTSSPEAVGLRWAGPMFVNVRAEPWPEGMTMEFLPAEGEPQKVIVKKGDQVWTTEVNSLDKLPDEIGTLVKQQLQLRNPHVARTFAYGATTSGNVNFVDQAIAPTLPLPDDVTMTTVRKGSAPAKVTLQKGDQTWDVTEKDLAAIPGDLRPFAAMALHGHLNSPAPFTKIIMMPASPPVMKEIRVTEPRPAKVAVPTTVTLRQAEAAAKAGATAKVIDRTQNQREIERQLKELSEQVEKLRQAVEKTQPKQ